MYPYNLQEYSKEMQELHKIYLEAGIWRKYNWYDFLKKLIDL